MQTLTTNYKNIEAVCFEAKQASFALGQMTTEQKNDILKVMGDALRANAQDILDANSVDVQNCKKPAHYVDRLKLTLERIQGMAKGIEDVIKLPDPVGRVLDSFVTDTALNIQKVSVPFGVVGIIYEARPNVTTDTAALCIKSGNAIILRGSSDALKSNVAIVNVLKNALKDKGMENGFIQIIDEPSREGAKYFMTLNKYIDVLVPRGSASLISETIKNSTIPVIETGTGNCHVYIHSDADIDMALKISLNAKISRPSVCNACESLLVDKSIAAKVLPLVAAKFIENNVEMRCCNESFLILKDKGLSQGITKACEQDFYEEYNDYIISVKVVSSVVDAVNHINKYGTRHSEAIVTQNLEAAKVFTAGVDSAAVYVNASTRFTDGGEFGFGAELGISTQKLHARGPVGLKELTSYKYIIAGNGQTR